MTTKIVRFADKQVPTSDLETEEDELGFVTKRTFELLEQDEPFLEKQFKNLKETAKEHCETWKENFKEVAGPMLDVVEPIKISANQCVDFAMEAIRRSNLQELMMGHRPQTLAMVGGPAPDLAQKLRNEPSLMSVESDEKLMYWGPMDEPDHERTSFILHDAPHPREVRPTIGILKQKRLSVQPEASMFQQLFDTENGQESCDQSTDADESTSTNSDAAETASSIEASTLASEHNEPSGKRPESPINLFSSQELDGDEPVDVYATEDYASFIPQGLNSQDPIVVDDVCFDEPEDDTREGAVDEAMTAERDDANVYGEERDQPPSSRGLEDNDSLDFRPIATDHHSHLPLSRTLLYSMRSRNRDIQSLLAELPTNYDFGRSIDEVDDADQASANGSSTVSLENSIDSTREFPSKSHDEGKKKFKFISFTTQKSKQSKAPSVDYARRDAAFRILGLGL
jgi:hypothetical protein